MMHGWPPNSPDLSPIEMCWAIVKAKLAKLPRAKTKDELEEQILSIWDAIPMTTINRLVLSFKRRLDMVKDRGGKSISPYLSSGKSHIAPIDIVPPSARPKIISPEEDIMLLEKYKLNGNRWPMTMKELEIEHLTRKVI